MKLSEFIGTLIIFPADAEIRISNWNDCSYNETTPLKKITYHSHENIIILEECMLKE